MTLHSETISAAEVVGSALQMVSQRSQEAGIAIHLEEAVGVPPITADRRRLLQVLLNLLGNAIKFTPEGGRVVLSLQPMSEGGLVIEIADNGVGMTEAELANALRPYGRNEQAVASGIEGTGLGLPIAKALTELHGARFNISSVKGVGTRVRLEFSAVAAKAAA